MGRYVFKRKDLEPLRALLDLPLARDVVNAAVPVKRFGRPQVQQETTLSVDVLSRDHADGVPLDEILREVQKTTPTATGIVARGDKIVITHSKAPTPQERTKLDGLLRDAPRLQNLKKPLERAAPRRADLEAVLRDEATPDSDWIREFRKYALEHLLKEG